MKSKTEKTWETVAQNLLRNEGGRYYAVFRVAGKQKWVSLKTDKRTVAEARLSKERERVLGTRRVVATVADGMGTFGDLAKLHLAEIEGSAKIGPKTKARYAQHIAAVLKTWPELSGMKPERLTRSAVEAWRDRVAREGTGFKPPGAKGRSHAVDGSSPGGINKMLDAIRRLLALAVDRGQLLRNPFQGTGLKLKVKPKKPELPEGAVLEQVFAKIESRGGGRPLACAELCRLLAYTGLRLGEAAGDKLTGTPGLTWSDVRFDEGFLIVRGTKTEAAAREVPLVPAARRLLETIRDRRLAAARELGGPDATLNPSARVLLVAEAQKALSRACAEVGVPRLTHHDLRDAFATSCIEAKVDIPTIAGWLGHVDGGALLMKTYAHLRARHSHAEAAKVTFGGEVGRG